MNTELRLDHNITSSNKHGKSAKDNRFTNLVKLLDMPETASGSNVQSNMLKELNMAKQGIAVVY